MVVPVIGKRRPFVINSKISTISNGLRLLRCDIVRFWILIAIIIQSLKDIYGINTFFFNRSRRKLIE